VSRETWRAAVLGSRIEITKVFERGEQAVAQECNRPAVVGRLAQATTGGLPSWAAVLEYPSYMTEIAVFIPEGLGASLY